MKVFLLLGLVLTAPVSVSQIVLYDVKAQFRNEGEPGRELFDFDGHPLTEGSEFNGDGAMLQFGYFSQATASNPFLGTFVPLTGENSRNGHVSTVGDSIRPDMPTFPAGQFWISPLFAFPHAMHGFDLPMHGTPMALRFYDGLSIAESTRYNTVASPTTPLWSWAAEPTPEANHVALDLRTVDPAAMLWEGGAGSEFRTTIPVPEPSVAMLIFAAIVAGLCRPATRTL